MNEKIYSTEQFVRDYKLDELFESNKDRDFEDEVDLVATGLSTPVAGALLGFAARLAKRKYRLPDWQSRAEDIASEALLEYQRALIKHIHPSNHNQMCRTYLDLMRWAVRTVGNQVEIIARQQVRDRVVSVPKSTARDEEKRREQEANVGTVAHDWKEHGRKKRPLPFGTVTNTDLEETFSEFVSLLVDPSMIEDDAGQLPAEARMIASEQKKILTGALKKRLEIHYQRQPERTLAVIEYISGEISPDEKKYGSAEIVAKRYGITVSQLQSYKSDMVRTWKRLREKTLETENNFVLERKHASE